MSEWVLVMWLAVAKVDAYMTQEWAYGFGALDHIDGFASEHECLAAWEKIYAGAGRGNSGLRAACVVRTGPKPMPEHVE